MFIDKVDEMERNLIFSYTITIYNYIEATEYYTTVCLSTNYTFLEHFDQTQQTFLLKLVRLITEFLPIRFVLLLFQ